MKTILTINTEYFHQEIGKLIYSFSQIVENMEYNSNELKIYYTLLKKIISNVTSANILIFENYINEAKIVLRSALETIVLLTYLSKFPNKIKDYLDEMQILKIKSNFIMYKNLQDKEVVEIDGRIYTKQELSLESENFFEPIRESAKKKLSDSLGIKKLVFNEKTFTKFEKYFSTLRPEFMRYEKMYRELDKSGFKIKDVSDYSLKDIIYMFYNDSSQVAHGCLLDWNHPQYLSQQEASYLFQYFVKTTLFVKVLLKGTLNFDIEGEGTHLIVMQQAIENLEKLVYGQKLKH